jgi:hypothetical protein
LNDACPAADGASTLSRSGAILALGDVKSNKPFSCPVALDALDDLFAEAAGAFTHTNSPKPSQLYLIDVELGASLGMNDLRRGFANCLGGSEAPWVEASRPRSDPH